MSGGKAIVIYPICGEGGKLHRFILLDRETPVPVHDPERDDVYMKVD